MVIINGTRITTLEGYAKLKNVSIKEAKKEGISAIVNTVCELRDIGMTPQEIGESLLRLLDQFENSD